MSKIYLSPDGENCLEKTAETTFYGFKFGSMWAVYEMVGRSKPEGVRAMASRYVYWVVPAVFMGATFASTACLMGKLRGKNDFVNHVVGAASTSSIIGLRYGAKNGLMWGFVLGSGAGLYKFFKDCGVEFLSMKPPAKDYGSFGHYNRHFGPRREVKEPTNY